MEERPREGDDPAAVADYYARVVRKAKQLQLESAGAGITADVFAGMPHQVKATTIMPNTRISGQTGGKRPASTALHADPVAPANSGIPPLGISRQDLLGNRLGGVTA